MRLSIIAVGLALAAAGGAHAQDSGPLTVSGSVRARYEALDGAARAGVAASESVYSLRSQLKLDYQAGPISFVGEVFDGRAYGVRASPALTPNEVNAFELVQAYAAVPLGPATVDIGRFAMDIGSRRLVANDDYRNTSNGFTGVRVEADLPGDVALTAFYTAPQIRLPNRTGALLENRVETDRETRDLLFWGALVGRRLDARTRVEAVVMRLQERDPLGAATRDRDLTTLDLRALREPAAGAFDYEVEAALQGGEIAAGTAPGAARLDVEAGFLFAIVGRRFDDPWRTRLALQYDWVSGDDGDAAFGRFDTLYGSRRTDFGPSGFYSVLGRANIASPAVRWEIRPNSRTEAWVVARALWLASRTDSFSSSGVRDATGASGSYAGEQIETRFRYWIVPEAVRLELNGVYLRKGRFLRQAPNANADRSNTRYMSANLTWSF